jgi:hypothetical protein
MKENNMTNHDESYLSIRDYIVLGSLYAHHRLTHLLSYIEDKDIWVNSLYKLEEEEWVKRVNWMGDFAYELERSKILK